jgi:hypothetical protein
VSNCASEYQKCGRHREKCAYFAQLIDLQLKFGAVLVLLDRAQEEVDLSDDDLCQGTGPGRTAGAGAGASTKGSRV